VKASLGSHLKAIYGPTPNQTVKLPASRYIGSLDIGHLSTELIRTALRGGVGDCDMNTASGCPTHCALNSK
jgi:hypothetical protein